jgi:hypothetical protein
MSGFNTSMLDAVAALGQAAASPSSRHSGWSDSDDSDGGGPPEPVPTPARRASAAPHRARTASRPAIDMARRQDMLDAAFPTRRRRPSATPAPRRTSTAQPPTAVRRPSTTPAPRRASKAQPPTAVRAAAAPPPPRAKPPPPRAKPPPPRAKPPPPPKRKPPIEDWEHGLREPAPPRRQKPPPPPPRPREASISDLERELTALKSELAAQTERNAALEARHAARERGADVLRADLADAEAERTRALRLVVGVLGRGRVERALANGGIGALLSDRRDVAYRPTGSMGPPTDAARRSRSDDMYRVTNW